MYFYFSSSQMLTLIGGKSSFDDYEKADKRISEEKCSICISKILWEIHN